jgi:hypothetical protein
MIRVVREGERMKFAKTVFWIAGLWGVLVLTPVYFLLDEVGRRTPPAVTHPEFYYGFVDAALAWQIVFFVIARDPIRFRPLMIPSMLEKFPYVATLLVLYAQGRLAATQLVFGATDFSLGVLFLIAFLKTPTAVGAATASRTSLSS